MVVVQSQERNKLLFRLLVLSAKISPIILAALCVLYSVLAYFYITVNAINYIGGISILFLYHLYLLSYNLKFCEYHRVPLHYILIINIIRTYNTYIGLSLEDLEYLMLELSAAGIALITYLYLKFKK